VRQRNREGSKFADLEHCVVQVLNEVSKLLSCIVRGKNGADCQLWDGDMQATKGFNIVVDDHAMPLKNNLPPCCGGKVPNDDPKVERPELGERHTHEGYTYYLVVPPKCKAKKCPLLVFFNFTSETGKITQMIDCPSCKEDMGVVALLPSWDQYMVTQPNFSMDGNYLTQSNIYGRSPSSGNIGLHDKFGESATKPHNDWANKGFTEKYLRGMVNQAIAENREFIDTSRVYVAGQSLAASAALYAGLAMPDVFRKAFIYSPTDFGCPLMKARLQKSLGELWNKHSSNRKLENISVFLGQADEASMDATTGRVGQGQGVLDWGTAASLMQEIGVFDSVAVQFQLVMGGEHAYGFSVNYKDYWES